MVGLRDAFFHYLTPEHHEQVARDVRSREHYVSNATRTLAPIIRDREKDESVTRARHSLYTITDLARSDALCELVDLRAMLASEPDSLGLHGDPFSPAALAYWMQRLRWNGYPAALASVNGVAEYERWLRELVRPNRADLQTASRLLLETQNVKRNVENRNATARIPT